MFLVKVIESSGWPVLVQCLGSQPCRAGAQISLTFKGRPLPRSDRLGASCPPGSSPFPPQPDPCPWPQVSGCSVTPRSVFSRGSGTLSLPFPSSPPSSSGFLPPSFLPPRVRHAYSQAPPSYTGSDSLEWRPAIGVLAKGSKWFCREPRPLPQTGNHCRNTHPTSSPSCLYPRWLPVAGRMHPCFSLACRAL